MSPITCSFFNHSCVKSTGRLIQVSDSFVTNSVSQVSSDGFVTDSVSQVSSNSFSLVSGDYFVIDSFSQVGSKGFVSSVVSLL